jgi:phospholipid-binding lipoprotein MlaA
MSPHALKSGPLSPVTAALTHGPSIVPILLAVVMVFLLVSCAHVPTDPEARATYDSANDPAEPTNRTIFTANEFVDHHALQPVARAYEHLPSRVRLSIHNFTANLKEPEIAINDTLQGNFSRAWNTTERFAINTTIGGAGLFDVASDWDRPHHDADFGQTFGVWGIATGPSVQLPILGFSNVRDAIGKVGDALANPLTFIPGGAMSAIEVTGGVGGAVDQRANLLSTTDILEQTSLDYYAALRSIEAQRRAALVAEGKAGDAAPQVYLGPPTLLPDAAPAPHAP